MAINSQLDKNSQQTKIYIYGSNYFDWLIDCFYCLQKKRIHKILYTCTTDVSLYTIFSMGNCVVTYWTG